MRSLLPLLESDMSLPWLHTVVASDASDTGKGVCIRSLDSHQVARVGRLSEKWRFRVEEAQRAREHALANPAEPRADPAFDAAIHPECISDLEFIEVPPDMLGASHWQVVQSRCWRLRENILRTEGRAVNWGLRRLMRSRENHVHRILMLVDNLPLCLPSCRTATALALAGNCRVAYRWIPSELNPADEPSRVKPIAGKQHVAAPYPGPSGFRPRPKPRA